MDAEHLPEASRTMTARWFTIRRDRQGRYEVTYTASDADAASGVYRTRDLADACDLTVALKRLGYSEVM